MYHDVTLVSYSEVSGSLERHEERKAGEKPLVETLLVIHEV